MTVQEFDDIYDKEITKRYHKHEIQRLSKRKDRDRERRIGAGRPFKLDLKNRFLMLLVYYRLYITYTLTGFLFDLDQSNVCRDIQKIESLIRKCVPIPKIYPTTKRLKTLEAVEKYFPGFLAFTDCTEQQIPRPADKNRGKCTTQVRRKDILLLKIRLRFNNRDFILHKVGYKKGRKHDYDIYKKNHPVIPKEVVNVVDLGYLGVETDFPEQLSALPYKKKINQCLSDDEKEFNKIHSKKRIIVEYIISRLKKYRIMSEV